MLKSSALLVTASLLTCLSLSPALADDWHGHGDIHSFHEHDYDHWREGRWVHGFHDGRDGWWWMVGGIWYYYPSPIYPYPDPYTPPTIVVEQAPPAPPTTAPSTVYYCSNPAGYYPYVPQCFAPWQRVASAAPAVAPSPAPAPAPVSADPHAADIQQLNAFSAELQGIDPHDEHAHAKLKALDSRVETFRQSLFQRSYNAMDVLHDAEDLKHRIQKKREETGHHTSGAPDIAAPTPPVSPAPPQH